MNKYSQHFSQPHQREPVFGRESEMIQNNAGGYVFKADKWTRFDRFLILGTEANTFYESSKKLTLDNAKNAIECIKEDGFRAVIRIVEVSDQGLGIKNDPAIFALALATHFGNQLTKSTAFGAVNRVCRTGTHIFQFAEARQAIGGGWGRSMRTAIGDWYIQKPVPSLIFQALKYRQREGWTHRDLLRLSHPKTNPKSSQGYVFDAICRFDKWAFLESQSLTVETFLKLQRAENAQEAAKIITNSGMSVPREFVLTEHLTDPHVWAALLPGMPMTAMIRNLGNMSKAGILQPLSSNTTHVVDQLTDEIELKAARIHPFSVLVAAKVYGAGKGVRGGNTWNVNPQIVAALEEAFEKSFTNVIPTGKRYLLGVDISGSMSFESSKLNGCIYPAEAAAAMALITARVEKQAFIGGFSTRFIDLGISSRDTLRHALAKTMNKAFGGTDTSVMINWAIENKVDADGIFIYSDGETWAGGSHTFQVLEKYRKARGIPAKFGAVNFTATRTSIADSKDPLSMDFVGLSADLPAAINAFVTE